MSSRITFPEALHNLFSELAEKAGLEFRRVWIRCQMFFVLVWGIAIAAAWYERYGLFVSCVTADVAALGGLSLYQRRGLGPFRVSVGGSWLSRLGLSKEFIISTRVYPVPAEAYTPLPRRLVETPEASCEADVALALAGLAEQDPDFGRRLQEAVPEGVLDRYAASNLTVLYVATRLPGEDKA